MAKDEIKQVTAWSFAGAKQVTAWSFAGALWPSREDAEQKMAEMDLKEWLRREHCRSMDDEGVFVDWIIDNRKKLVELLSKIK